MTTALNTAIWAELTEGVERELTVGPITRTDLVRYAGASGDFNPNHHDEIYAITRGVRQTLRARDAPGGYLARLLSEWLGARFFQKSQNPLQRAGMAWRHGDLQGQGVRQYEEAGTVW